MVFVNLQQPQWAIRNGTPKFLGGFRIGDGSRTIKGSQRSQSLTCFSRKIKCRWRPLKSYCLTYGLQIFETYKCRSHLTLGDLSLCGNMFSSPSPDRTPSILSRLSSGFHRAIWSKRGGELARLMVDCGILCFRSLFVGGFISSWLIAGYHHDWLHDVTSFDRSVLPYDWSLDDPMLKPQSLIAFYPAQQQ